MSEPAIVAAIVTSELGVLLGRRRDGKATMDVHRWSAGGW
jgi:hypothetical protein